jgi:hypothetical protein
MTRAKKAKAQRRSQAAAAKRQASGQHQRVLFGAAALVVAIGAGLLWAVAGDRGGSSAADPGPIHVHGLGINPADGALYIATHTGLYRSTEGESTSVRVGDSHQDTMGFTVVGANRFLGSGHPDLRQDLPPLLGLIESTDKGRTWESISLLGEADFHVLRSADDRVNGYDSSNDRLMVSANAGRTWDEGERPAPLLDLAVDPGDDRHLIASGASDLDQGLYESGDGGANWERVADAVGLLAWPTLGRLYLVDGNGSVFVSMNQGGSFERRGSIGDQPAALLGQEAEVLFAALHDGTIKSSSDGGAAWTVRSTP